MCHERVGKMEFIIAGVIGFIVLYLIISYNSLIRMRNRVRESFAAIDVYLMNRFDALTKISETVVSYAEHERGTFEKIVELRQKLNTPMPDEEKVDTYNQLDKMVSGLNIQVENYPELKASDNYIHLQRTINDLEEKLSASRRTYNANVTRFNSMIETIPTNIFANMMGFEVKTILEIEEAKKGDVSMKSLLGR
jgi:LemA protein